MAGERRGRTTTRAESADVNFILDLRNNFAEVKRTWGAEEF
jgi:hypothetical protein